MSKEIHTGNIKLNTEKKDINGVFVNIKGEKFYKIENYDQMPPFFMSIVSAYDHWIFISGTGALSAGRKDKENSLFPYYTDDIIHDSADITGSKTIIFATKNSENNLWEPFSDKYEFVYNIERNIYKNILGNVIIFEEINKDLDLVFKYTWQTGNRYGFIRFAEIENRSDEISKINILDGIQNILPAGVNSGLQTNYSTLIDAYKKNELNESGIGIFYLSSIPTDKAEPSEGLKASTVWSVGLMNSEILLSSKQVENFRRYAEVENENDIRASRGAYFLRSDINLLPNEKKAWYIVADVNSDLTDIAKINHLLNNGADLTGSLNEDITKGSNKLKSIIGYADGLQITSDDLSTSRHMANVLFNVMRGGIFDDTSGIDSGNYRCHIENCNSIVYNKNQDFLNALPDYISYSDLIKKAEEIGNPDLIRLTFEYLPLVFSRRHGDPSRPWNNFSIKLDDENGRNIFSYEGNWRDIFQNWEALALSYPKYIESMVVKFINASTTDGYNPYRISESGIDWEVIEPENPWSNIGYWGDHQIIYLQKLLELSVKYNPQSLNKLLNEEIFCFANVPYRIKSYDEICRDPYNTIIFDSQLHSEIISESKTLGSDAKLVHTSEGEIFRVNLLEKLLLTLFTKLSNFVPEAGIWLNTQRPEWNDANNALVGHGASMVTLYYMRRYIKFLLKIFKDYKGKEISISKEITQFYFDLSDSMNEYLPILNKQFSDQERMSFTDSVGQAGSTYRKLVYGRHSGIKTKISIKKINDFLDLAIKYIEHSVKSNKREDDMYHSYNLLLFDTNKKSLKINRLYEMLEGQTAVLSSGYLSVNDSIQLLDSLKRSKMFRSDQYSYMLYPNRELKKFTEKNSIPEEYTRNSDLFKILDKNDDKSLVVKDLNGIFHFNAKFRNKEDLKSTIEDLDKKNYGTFLKKEKKAILDLWENMFKHSEFTGRSGTFYGYEGLGCIYWHMVSKLLLAVGELYYSAFEQNVDSSELSKLVEHYYEIRAGIGLNKSPEVYGAFPTDPYSHTPLNAGAQQPGMTGQVKEDIISRFYELGVLVSKGCLRFIPALLRKSEFIDHKKTFSYVSNTGKHTELLLNSEELAFSYCGIPIVYKISDKHEIEVIYSNKTIRFNDLILDKETSKSIFKRENKIKKINVFLTPELR